MFVKLLMLNNYDYKLTIMFHDPVIFHHCNLSVLYSVCFSISIACPMAGDVLEQATNLGS